MSTPEGNLTPSNRFAGGIGRSGPDIKLFTSDFEYDAFWGRLQGKDTLSARGNLTQSADADALYVQRSMGMIPNVCSMTQVSTFDNFTMSLNEMMVSKNGGNLTQYALEPLACAS